MSEHAGSHNSINPSFYKTKYMGLEGKWFFWRKNCIYCMQNKILRLINVFVVESHNSNCKSKLRLLNKLDIHSLKLFQYINLIYSRLCCFLTQPIIIIRCFYSYRGFQVDGPPPPPLKVSNSQTPLRLGLVLSPISVNNSTIDKSALIKK